MQNTLLLNLDLDWLVDCMLKSNCSLVGPEIIVGIPSMGALSNESYQVFTQVLEKTQKTPNG